MLSTQNISVPRQDTLFGNAILPRATYKLTLPPDEGDDKVLRPNIEWLPNVQTYLERVQRLKSAKLERPTSVPAGWPEQLSTKRVWSGSDFANSEEFIMHLNEDDVKEIEDALEFFKGLPKSDDPDNINKSSFPLPSLESRLNDVSEQVHAGRGFALIRGLNPSKYSPLDNLLIYVGITTYIAETRGCQDYDGRMAVHIQDIREDVRDYAKRGPFSPYTSSAQPFHTDRCDILAMYAYDVAATGGQSIIASGGKIYNELAQNRPDILHVLTEDKWIFDEFHNGDYHTRPLLHKFGSHGPGFVYSRRPLTGAWFSPHHPAVPAMTEIQAEALDAVHFTAEKHQLELTLQRGDIELLNNFALFHARRGFVDDPSANRHFIRLWLRNEEKKWEVPEVVRRSAEEIYDKNGPFRSKPIWDIDWSPPIGRGPYKRMECN